MSKTILVVAAHPDDEVLGCGGSMAKWSKAGNEVHVVIMAEGSTSRDKSRDRNARKKELSHLSYSAKTAGKILGIKSVDLLNWPDNRMDSIDLLDVVKIIEAYIERLKPEVVVTHHYGDLNIDHQILNQAVMVACRPQPGHPVKCILSFEVPSATEWQTSTVGSPFSPNWFEDITDTLELKMSALKAYESEMRDWPHARSIMAVKHLCSWRGSSVGCDAAEAFILLRQLCN